MLDWRCSAWKAVSDMSCSPRISQLQKKMEIWSLPNRWKQENFASITLTRLHFVNCCQFSLKGLGLSLHFKGWQHHRAPFCWMIFEKTFPLIKHCCKQWFQTCCLHSSNANLHVQIWSAMWQLANFSFLYQMFSTKMKAHKRPSREEPNTRWSITAPSPVASYFCCWEKQC